MMIITVSRSAEFYSTKRRVFKCEGFCDVVYLVKLFCGVGPRLYFYRGWCKGLDFRQSAIHGVMMFVCILVISCRPCVSI